MASEIWQFATFLGAVTVAFVLWMSIIYLPGRTMEHRYDGTGAVRRSPQEDPQVSDGEEATQSSSDRTR